MSMRTIGVPSKSLETLKCVKCQRYLSFFPIYLNEKSGSVCGRCPKPKNNSQINDTYENLAKHMKFPCANDTFGCTNYLLPSDIPMHENYCPFKKLSCPTENATECKWQGFYTNLLEHFEETHLTFLMKNCNFEIDFVNKYKENYLLPYANDLFIFTRECKTDSKTLSFYFTYVGTNPSMESYSYKLIFKSGCGATSDPFAAEHNILEKTELDAKVLKEVLNDPMTVIVDIEIFYKPQPEDSEETDLYSEAIDLDLLSELECPVCFEYMVPPIILCGGGHSMCKGCKGTQALCPLCRSEFSGTQNYTLEKMVSFIKYPCKHERCKFVAKAKDIKEHEKLCSFGPFKCPLHDYENCEFETILSELYQHVVDKHYENVLEMNHIDTPFFGEQDEDCFILEHSRQLFQLHYKFANNKFYWSMQFVGPPEKSKNYKFELDIIDNSGNNLRAYLKGPCAPVCERATCFDDDKIYLTMDIKQIRSLISNEFSYRVRILEE